MRSHPGRLGAEPSSCASGVTHCGPPRQRTLSACDVASTTSLGLRQDVSSPTRLPYSLSRTMAALSLLKSHVEVVRDPVENGARLRVHSPSEISHGSMQSPTAWGSCQSSRRCVAVGRPRHRCNTLSSKCCTTQCTRGTSGGHTGQPPAPRRSLRGTHVYTHSSVRST